jgi:hypothetical protein
VKINLTVFLFEFSFFCPCAVVSLLQRLFRLVLVVEKQGAVLLLR